MKTTMPKTKTVVSGYSEGALKLMACISVYAYLYNKGYHEEADCFDKAFNWESTSKYVLKDYLRTILSGELVLPDVLRILSGQMLYWNENNETREVCCEYLLYNDLRTLFRYEGVSKGFINLMY